MTKNIAIVSAGPSGHQTWVGGGIKEQWDTIIMVNSAALVHAYGPCDIWAASDRSWLINPEIRPAHPVRRHIRTMDGVIRCKDRGEMPHLTPLIERWQCWKGLHHFKRGLINYSMHVALIEAIEEAPADVTVFGHDCALTLYDCAQVKDNTCLNKKRWEKENAGIEEITGIMLANHCTVSYRHAED